MKKLTKNPKVEQLIEDADHLFACLHRPKQALKKINQALSISPDHVEGLVIKGRILFQLDRLKEAWACSKTALSINPKFGEAYIERARMLYGIKQDFKKALVEVKKALKYAGRDRWVRAYALGLKGDVLEELDQTREALKCYVEAQRLNPKDDHTHWSLGNALSGNCQIILSLYNQTPPFVES